MAYLAVTLLMIFFAYTKLHNPESMIWGRMRVVAITASLWAVYRMVPCRLMVLARAVAQMALLSWWYPDTYELNRLLPNLDHVFATWEQQLFGCQPALLFCQQMPQHWFSELMDLGYASYFPMILVVMLFVFLFRYKDFQRTAWIVAGSFFLYYIIYVVLPVTGPQYYFGAVGLDEIAKGVFPNVGDYFNTHAERMTSPGWSDGVFYQMVENAHNAGERPTAAFPSSHVGVSTILMLLALRTRNKWLCWGLLPFYVLLCVSTVYIQAHYVVDAIAGLISGVAFYYLFMLIPKKL
ncbi:MAG: phosphatase PAP2 family protein [Prevotella sp.]|nr:phosphatase PAP2 family protein [Prevotella sp.]